MHKPAAQTLSPHDTLHKAPSEFLLVLARPQLLHLALPFQIFYDYSR